LIGIALPYKGLDSTPRLEVKRASICGRRLGEDIECLLIMSQAQEYRAELLLCPCRILYLAKKREAFDQISII
jgi:hypothetical protein